MLVQPGHHALGDVSFPEVSGVTGQGLRRGCPLCGGTSHEHVSAAGAGENEPWVRESRSGPGPGAVGHRSVPASLLADFISLLQEGSEELCFLEYFQLSGYFSFFLPSCPEGWFLFLYLVDFLPLLEFYSPLWCCICPKAFGR